MPIGTDVQNTTYSDMRPAKAKSDKSKRQRKMMRQVVKSKKSRAKTKNSPKSYGGY